MTAIPIAITDYLGVPHGVRDAVAPEIGYYDPENSDT